jgi:hypothetical protein
VETEASEKTNALGFSGVSAGAPDFFLVRVASDRRFQMDGKQRVGLNEAQAGGENVGLSLRCFNIRAAGLVTGSFSFLGRAGLSCLGSIRPGWAERKSAQTSAALIFVRGLGNRAVFLFWAGLESIFGPKSVKEFSI